jgi:hypothetical protein
MDFPIGERLDDRLCLIWLERHLQADGLLCPRCGGTERRLLRAQGHVPAHRGHACDGDYTLLTGAAFAKTRPRPTTLVWRRRGIARGELTARLAREWGLSHTAAYPAAAPPAQPERDGSHGSDGRHRLRGG